METLRDRNSTSFQKELNALLKKLQHEKTDILQYHQRITHDYLLKYPHVRGVLGYQEMGSGKSILAVSVCESVLRAYPDKRILIITSKSLQNNMRESIEKYINLQVERGQHSVMDADTMERHIQTNYNFISLNAGNMLRQVNRVNKPEDLERILGVSELMESKDDQNLQSQAELEKIRELGNLDDTFVVIDEAHNFFNSIAHGSKNAMGLYYMIMDAKRIKLLFLTGSPIINDPYEVALCYNMLAGRMDPGSDSGPETLFGEDYESFVKYFIDHAAGLDPNNPAAPIMKNMDKFANRIVGLTSYYSTLQGDSSDKFPEMLPLQVVTVPMSNKQYGLYSLARDKELEEAKRNVFKTAKKTLQKPSGASSSYRVRSRQISNVLYPESASEVIQEGGNMRYVKYPDRIPKETFSEEQLRIYSPKILSILQHISKHTLPNVLKPFSEDKSSGSKKSGSGDKPGIGPVLVYSQFLDSGISILAQALEYYGMKNIQSQDEALKGPPAGGGFCIISGEVDTDVRSELIRVFNSTANTHGEIISVLLFTSTGAEGMDTHRVRAVMIMEPYWHWARHLQVWYRGIRFESHMDLPPEERNMQPYIFLSDYPEGSGKNKETAQHRKLEDTTDVTLYKKAKQNQELIQQFLKVMQQCSLDCCIWSTDCRICQATGRILFVPNLDKDMSAPNNCIPERSEKIQAKSVTLGDVEYKYTADKHATPEITMYKYNSNLDGYEVMSIADPEYVELYNVIAKKEKLPILDI